MLSPLRDHKFYFKEKNPFLHIYRFLFNPSYRIIYLFRLTSELPKIPGLYQLIRLYYIHQTNLYSIYLVPKTKIAPGLHFPHGGPIVINASSNIGEQCIIHPCVLIGGNRSEKGKGGVPKIGNKVFIGNGAKIIGKVSIGNNVFIAPGAIVTKDIPDDYIVGAGLNCIISDKGGAEKFQFFSDVNLE